MKVIHNKKLLLCIAVVALICVSAIYIFTRKANNTSQQPSSAQQSAAQECPFSFIDQFNLCKVSNQKEVSAEEIPWKTTICLIEDDSMLLMTPTTGVKVSVHVPQDCTGLMLEGRIHEWMADYSDGATLRVQVGDQETLIHYSAGDAPSTDIVDLSAYANQTVEISLECLQEADSSGDWILLSKAEIDNKNTNPSSAQQSAAQECPFSFIDQFNLCKVSNQKEVSAEEIPWKTTICLIEDDSMLLMTPTTGVKVSVHVPQDCTGLILEGRIHEWMADYSDGATLRVQVGDQETLIHYSAGDAPRTDTVDLSAYADQTVEISLECLQEANSSGDWILLSKAEIDNNSADSTANGNNVIVQNDNDYWKTAFYFSDAFPIEFWDSEWDNIDEDFNRIKDDGFNSIALVIPWRQFQPHIVAQPGESTFEELSFQRLEEIIQKADTHGLGVILRIGYFWDRWDSSDSTEIQERYYKLIYDDTYMNAWIEYVNMIKAVKDRHTNVWGGFICWEDFWKFVKDMQEGKLKKDIKEIAQEIGFQKYVEEEYGLDRYNAQNNVSFETIQDITLPGPNDTTLWIFYEFYDQKLNSILEMTQSIWPEVSMEVRTDADLVMGPTGIPYYYSHADTYRCGTAGYTSVMYGIPQGADNQGEVLDADAVLPVTKWVFNSINEKNDGKTLYINQFLFYDDTAGFGHNARLKEDQIDDYLRLCAPLLLEQTMGYGIWTYQDYYCNALYNKGFYHGLDGWNTEGPVELLTDNSNRVLIRKGGKLSQYVPLDVTYPGLTTYITLMVQADNECVLNVQIGDVIKKHRVHAGNAPYTLELPTKVEDVDFSIWADADIVVDNINMYSFIQHGKVYDIYGNPSDNQQDVCELNKTISKWLDRFDYVKEFESATVSGIDNDVDTPWKTNIGVISDADIGKAVFMMPGTSLSYHVLVEKAQMEFSFTGALYPQCVDMKVSDGAGISLKINDEEISREIIPADGSEVVFRFPVDQYVGEDITITIQCDDGPSDNSNGDWVVIQNVLDE